MCKATSHGIYYRSIEQVAWMKQSGIQGRKVSHPPDYVALHPGYLLMPQVLECVGAAPGREKSGRGHNRGLGPLLPVSLTDYILRYH